MIATATATLKPFILHIASICKKSLHTTTITNSNSNSPLRLPLTSLQCGAILQSLTNTKSFVQGQKLHSYMLTCGNLQNNTYLSSKLAAFYAACGRMTQAQVIFNGVALKNSFLWNFMIRGYASDGYVRNTAMEALTLFYLMGKAGLKADGTTLLALLSACADWGSIKQGKEIHCYANTMSRKTFLQQIGSCKELTSTAVHP
ncbi:unnamed protein product [Citrullus colocynthis]|uniref:Pentatricopeptide repeat-containing protein n=1 Tax=Citrullus colocynthis TaxID=252529 RepID=A0ABP0Y705_9ROSI